MSVNSQQKTKYSIIYCLTLFNYDDNTYLIHAMIDIYVCIFKIYMLLNYVPNFYERDNFITYSTN